MPRLKKAAKIAGLILAGLVLIGFVLQTCLNYSASKELEEELAAIEKSGCPLSPEGFAPPEVPDEENAIVLYKRAFDIFNPGKGEQGAMWRETDLRHPENWSSQQRKVIRSILDRNSAVYELLKQAASCKRSRLPFDYSDYRRYDYGDIDKFLPWSFYGDATKFLVAKALLDSEDGKVDDAVKACQIGIHFGNVLYSEPNVGAQAYRIGFQGKMYKTLKTIFARGEPSLGQCRALLEEILSYGAEAPLTRALEMQRCVGLEMFIKPILKGETNVLFQPHTTLGEKFKLKLYTSWIGRPILKKEFAYHLRDQRKLIAAFKVPYLESVRTRKYVPEKPRWYYLLSRGTVRLRYDGLAEDNADCEAKAGSCQLALAVRIYKKEKGKYPESSDELCPAVLENLPKDPFTGGGFLCHRDKQGFIIYSVGKNLKDDGGRGDDIAWGFQN